MERSPRRPGARRKSACHATRQVFPLCCPSASHPLTTRAGGVPLAAKEPPLRGSAAGQATNWLRCMGAPHQRCPERHVSRTAIRCERRAPETSRFCGRSATCWRKSASVTVTGQPDRARRIDGLVLEVKGDFRHKMRGILEKHGRADNYVEVSPTSNVPGETPAGGDPQHRPPVPTRNWIGAVKIVPMRVSRPSKRASRTSNAKYAMARD